MSRTILITGGCGFVGTNLALKYSREPDTTVILVDNFSRKQSIQRWYRFLKHKHNILLLEGDVSTALQTSELENDRIDLILNCASQSRSTKGIQYPMDDFNDNVKSAFAAGMLARRIGCPLIHWSSNKVYPEPAVNRYNQKAADTRFLCLTAIEKEDANLNGPRSIYGATKRAAEILLQEMAHTYQVPIIINRFSCLYGDYQLPCSDQGWVSQIYLQHRFDKGPVNFYGWRGKQVRDILHIKDLLSLIDLQEDWLQSQVSNGDEVGCQIYNVGGGIDFTVSLQELVSVCEYAVAAKLDAVYHDPRPCDHRVFWSDNLGLKETFDWTPTVMPVSGLRDYAKWVGDNLEWVERNWKE